MNWCFGHEWTVAVVLFDFSGYLVLSQSWNEIKEKWKLIYLNRDFENMILISFRIEFYQISNQRNHDIRIVNVNGNIVLCWFKSILEIG